MSAVVTADAASMLADAKRGGKQKKQREDPLSGLFQSLLVSKEQPSPLPNKCQNSMPDIKGAEAGETETAETTLLEKKQIDEKNGTGEAKLFAQTPMRFASAAFLEGGAFLKTAAVDVTGQIGTPAAATPVNKSESGTSAAPMQEDNVNAVSAERQAAKGEKGPLSPAGSMPSAGVPKQEEYKAAKETVEQDNAVSDARIPQGPDRVSDAESATPAVLPSAQPAGNAEAIEAAVKKEDKAAVAAKRVQKSDQPGADGRTKHTVLPAAQPEAIQEADTEPENAAGTVPIPQHSERTEGEADADVLPSAAPSAATQKGDDSVAPQKAQATAPSAELSGRSTYVAEQRVAIGLGDDTKEGQTSRTIADALKGDAEIQPQTVIPKERVKRTEDTDAPQQTHTDDTAAHEGEEQAEQRSDRPVAAERSAAQKENGTAGRVKEVQKTETVFSAAEARAVSSAGQMVKEIIPTASAADSDRITGLSARGDAVGMQHPSNTSSDWPQEGSESGEAPMNQKGEPAPAQETRQAFKMEMRVNDVVINARVRQDTLNLMIDMEGMQGLHETLLGHEIQNILDESGFRSYRLTIREKSRKVYEYSEEQERVSGEERASEGVSIRA